MNKTNVQLPDSFVAPPCSEEIQMLYEDPYLLVINKPSGLLSLSGKNPLNKDSVHFRLVQNHPTAMMVHRLDFGTSGLMILALNKTINADLTKQFQARTIIKKYEAILLGDLAEDEGVIDAPIAKAHFPHQTVCIDKGKPAQSHYTVIERLEDAATGVKTTRVLFTPKTGRTHQLRVHSREIGHPIIGCDLYGLTVDGVDSQGLATRLMLHARSLEFDHPATGERIKIVAKNRQVQSSGSC